MAADLTSPESAQPHAPSPTHIQLQRVTHRIIHVSLRDRIREVDYCVENPTQQDFHILYLPLGDFVRNLEIIDEDGRRLNFLPHRHVKEILKQIEVLSPVDFSYFSSRFKHVKYPIAIIFPHDALFKSGTVRTVRLRYEETKPVKTHPLLGRLGKLPQGGFFVRSWEQWKARIFSTPYMEIDVERYPDQEYDLFVVIIAPPASMVRGTDVLEPNPNELNEWTYRNGLQDDSRVASIRLPPYSRERYRWHLTYDLQPVRPARVVLASLFLVFTWAAAGLALWNLGQIGTILQRGDVAAAIGTSIFGTLFTLNDPSEDRYKLLLLPPLAIEGFLVASKLLALAA